LPTINTICERDDAVATFVTSEICRPMEKLMRYQRYIEDFIIPPEYEIRDTGQGVQPWEMPIIGTYDRVYQLGFNNFPHGPIPLVIARKAGLSEVPNPTYDFPVLDHGDEPYVVVGFSAIHSYPPIYYAYREMIERCPIKVVQTGAVCDRIEIACENKIGLDLLDTLSLLSQARLFVGFYSGLLVLANGFPELQRIITLPHIGCGEQHGIHLPKTLEIAFPPDVESIPVRQEKFQQALINAVLLELDK
jgi:hypothetical protein